MNDVKVKHITKYLLSDGLFGSYGPKVLHLLVSGPFYMLRNY